MSQSRRTRYVHCRPVKRPWVLAEFAVYLVTISYSRIGNCRDILERRTRSHWPRFRILACIFVRLHHSHVRVIRKSFCVFCKPWLISPHTTKLPSISKSWVGGEETTLPWSLYLRCQFFSFLGFSLLSLSSETCVVEASVCRILYRSERGIFFLNPHSAIFLENWRFLVFSLALKTTRRPCTQGGSYVGSKPCSERRIWAR
jgi:hypothetical protein